MLLSKPSRLMNCQRYDPRGGVKTEGGGIGAAAGHGHHCAFLLNPERLEQM